MRYLSEDGKLFNTIEECKEHEKKFVNDEQKNKRISEIKKKYEQAEKILDEVDKLMDAFIDDYPESCIKDLSFIIKDAKKIDVSNDFLRVLDELEDLFTRKK